MFVNLQSNKLTVYMIVSVTNVNVIVIMMTSWPAALSRSLSVREAPVFCQNWVENMDLNNIQHFHPFWNGDTCFWYLTYHQTCGLHTTIYTLNCKWEYSATKNTDVFLQSIDMPWLSRHVQNGGLKDIRMDAAPYWRKAHRELLLLCHCDRAMKSNLWQDTPALV